MPKLLREFETLNYDKNVIKEQKDKTGKIVLQGILQRSGAPNQNKRIYPREILEREIGNYKKLVEAGESLGQLDHPSDSIIELANVSHIIRDVWWDGDNVIGKVELLDTPKGKIAQELVESGIKLGISSRAVGETTKNNEGYDVVNNDLMLICFDIVANPSTDGAWLNLREAKEISFDKLPKKIRLSKLMDEILKVK